MSWRSSLISSVVSSNCLAVCFGCPTLSQPSHLFQFYYMLNSSYRRDSMLGTLGSPSNGMLSERCDLVTSFIVVVHESLDIHSLPISSSTNTSRLDLLIDFLLVATKRVSHFGPTKHHLYIHFVVFCTIGTCCKHSFLWLCVKFGSAHDGVNNGNVSIWRVPICLLSNRTWLV